MDERTSSGHGGKGVAFKPTVHSSLAGGSEQARSHDIDSSRAVVKTKSHVNEWPGEVPGTQ